MGPWFCQQALVRHMYSFDSILLPQLLPPNAWPGNKQNSEVDAEGYVGIQHWFDDGHHGIEHLELCVSIAFRKHCS
jgi:hypothetical protein